MPSLQPGRGGPCSLLKLRQMGTHGVHMKGVLPWLVHWACRAGTRNFCPTLAALEVDKVQNILFPRRIPTSFVPIGRAASPISYYVSLVATFKEILTGWLLTYCVCRRCTHAGSCPASWNSWEKLNSNIRHAGKAVLYWGKERPHVFVNFQKTVSRKIYPSCFSKAKFRLDDLHCAADGERLARTALAACPGYSYNRPRYLAVRVTCPAGTFVLTCLHLSPKYSGNSGTSLLSRESGKEKTKVQPDCSFAPTQLALCLRLAYSDLKGESCYTLS